MSAAEDAIKAHRALLDTLAAAEAEEEAAWNAAYEAAAARMFPRGIPHRLTVEQDDALCAEASDNLGSRG